MADFGAVGVDAEPLPFAPPVTFTGTAVQTLPAFTQAAAGTAAPPTFAATAALALPAFMQQATGTATAPVFTGLAASTLPSFTQTATGLFVEVGPDVRGWSTSSTTPTGSSGGGLARPNTSTGALTRSGSAAGGVT